MRRALAQGVSGFLLKDASASELAAATRAVAPSSTSPKAPCATTQRCDPQARRPQPPRGHRTRKRKRLALRGERAVRPRRRYSLIQAEAVVTAPACHRGGRCLVLGNDGSDDQ